MVPTCRGTKVLQRRRACVQGKSISPDSMQENTKMTWRDSVWDTSGSVGFQEFSQRRTRRIQQLLHAARALFLLTPLAGKLIANGVREGLLRREPMKFL